MASGCSAWKVPSGKPPELFGDVWMEGFLFEKQLEKKKNLWKTSAEFWCFFRFFRLKIAAFLKPKDWEKKQNNRIGN